MSRWARRQEGGWGMLCLPVTAGHSGAGVRDRTDRVQRQTE